MESFMEKLLKRKFNINQEILSIHELLHERPDNSYSTVYDFIDNNFKTWVHRHNYISIQQFLTSTGIVDIIEKAKENCCNIDDFVYYAECVQNLIGFVYDKIEVEDFFLARHRNIILDNIKNVVDSSNLQIKYLKDKDWFIITPHNWKANQAINIIEDKYNLGEKILSYLHHSMYGQLYEKSDILCRFYKCFEGKYEKILNANNYNTIASDIGFLSDKLDVRHSPNKQEKKLLESMTSEDLENWYNILFDLYLDMLILCDHIESHKKVKELKSQLN